MKQLNKEQMNEQMTIKSLTDFLIKELSLDYNRVWQYCDENIKSLEAENKVLKSDTVIANTTSEERQLSISKNDGMCYAYQQIKNKLEFKFEGLPDEE